MTELRNPHVKLLFEWTRERVSERQISDYSPSDPGYASYVRLWTRIHRSGEIPKQSEFDLSEVIGLTGWADADDFREPKRFRAYRRFTSAVAVALITLGNDTESVRIGNYLARDLLIDVALEDQDHFRLVRAVLPVVRETLKETGYEEEYPFFSFASLILAQQASDFEEVTTLAAQLLQDESDVRNNETMQYAIESSRFLFGLTNYDQLNADWLRFASELSNPTNDPSLQLFIQALTESSE